MNDTEGYAWRVSGAAAVGHAGNIGIIASLLFPRYTGGAIRFTLSLRDPHLDPGGYPCEPCLGVHYSRLRSSLWLVPRAPRPHAQSYLS